jgi:RNA polymerase sigma-70 factor, ECF subfamily
MDDSEWLAERFEAHRPHLRAVAYRMLGSLAEADDTVQDAWLRVSRAGTDEVENLGGWLTTIVARLCLNVLRARRVRQEEPLEVHVPDPVVRSPSQGRPEDEALIADSVGLALLVVLETLTPAERLAFVLHDLFALPFDEIAPMVDRSPTAARQLASRARRKVQGAEVPPDMDLAQQRAMVDAFFAATRDGDFDRLVTLLHPEVVLRMDGGAALPASSMVLQGADAVTRQAGRGLRGVLSRPGTELRPALVNGTAGVVVIVAGVPMTIIAFTMAGGAIVEIDAIANPERVPTLAAALLVGD